MKHQFSQLDEDQQSRLTKIVQKQLSTAIADVNCDLTVQSLLSNAYNILETGKPLIVEPITKSPKKKAPKEKDPKKKSTKKSSSENVAKSPKKKTTKREENFSPEEIKFQDFMKLEIKNNKEEYKDMPYKQRILMITHKWCVLTDEEKESIVGKLGKFE